MFKWKYFWPYLLFAGTIIALVVANSINIQNEIKRNLSYTKTLNVSGRQRMLSQKLTKISYEVQRGDDVREKITPNLQKWQNAHDNLRNSNGGLDIYSDEHTEMIDMFNELSVPFDKLTKAFSQVANGTENERTYAVITENEPMFLTQMDAIVGELEANAKADLLTSETRQTWLAIISGLVLLLEMVVFVYPYHKRLVNAYKKLSRQKEELEQQHQLIAHLNETNDLIIKGTNAGIREWDIETGEEVWTDKFYQLLGFDNGEVVANNDVFVDEFLHPEDKPKVLNALDEHLRNKVPFKQDVRLKNKGGLYRWYETSGQALWNERGKPLRMATSIIDIEDRRATREKMLQENTAKDKLLSIIAHDLRTPVNNLISLIDMLKNNLIDKEEFLDYIDSVSENVHAMSESMDNILTWAKAQAKGWQVSPSEMKVDDVIQECIKLYMGKIGDKNITLAYKPDTMLKAYADFNQTVLIVRNVLNNALKFTPENGSIVIRVINEAGQAKITIKDTGVGMSAETLEKVLSSKKVYTTKGTNGEKGTGLGMNMCFEFAEKNNCKLDIDSKLNEGTTVTLTIPKTNVVRKTIALTA